MTLAALNKVLVRTLWTRLLQHVRLVPVPVRCCTIAPALLAFAAAAWADTPPPSLKTVTVPVPSNLSEFVKDKPAAIRLGKALFWDQQVGSDGQACGTCHFAAGADGRIKNQLDPGLDASPSDTLFGNNPLTGRKDYPLFGPNYTLSPAAFPLRKLANPDDRSSNVLGDTNDVVSSQGVMLHQYVDIKLYYPYDKGQWLYDTVFSVGKKNVRRVEPRNAPTMINAVFNFHNFWDGRADPNFNGVNPFGPADQDSAILVNVGGELTAQKILIPVSSLASQAVGPPVSDMEMSYRGRTFAQVGRKLLSLRPLDLQHVHPQDSVLGPLARARLLKGRAVGSTGLNATYGDMIRQAFQDKYWNSNRTIKLTTSASLWHKAAKQDPRNYFLSSGKPSRGSSGHGPPSENEYTQMEANFSLFFGLAVQMYESTLIADDTPFDQFQEGKLFALSDQQQRGMNIFFNKGNCSQCHGGSELTEASVSKIQASTSPNAAPADFLDELTTLEGPEANYDAGWPPTSVRMIDDDLGRDGTAPFTNPLTSQPYPLAHVLLMDLKAQGLLPASYAAVVQDLPMGVVVGARKAVQAGFKVPGLRNVELTGPYFHNGGQATLMQVVKFYNRGSDFAATNAAVHDTRVTPLGLTTGEQKDLVSFLLSLTDERVRREQAPFDHPEITVPSGFHGDQNRIYGRQEYITIPATGAGGLPGLGLPPLKPFMGLDPYQP